MARTDDDDDDELKVGMKGEYIRIYHLRSCNHVCNFLNMGVYAVPICLGVFGYVNFQITLTWLTLFAKLI